MPRLALLVLINFLSSLYSIFFLFIFSPLVLLSFPVWLWYQHKLYSILFSFYLFFLPVCIIIQYSSISWFFSFVPRIINRFGFFFLFIPRLALLVSTLIFLFYFLSVIFSPFIVCIIIFTYLSIDSSYATSLVV